MLSLLLVYYLIDSGQVPERVYLRDGRWFANQLPIRLCGGQLEIGLHGERLLFPIAKLDLVRTFTPKPQPKLVKRDRHTIPWEAPQFSAKRAGCGKAELTTAGLLAFVAEVGPQPNLDHLYDEPDQEPIADNLVPPDQRPFRHQTTATSEDEDQEGSSKQQKGSRKKNTSSGRSKSAKPAKPSKDSDRAKRPPSSAENDGFVDVFQEPGQILGPQW